MLSLSSLGTFLWEGIHSMLLSLETFLWEGINSAFILILGSLLLIQSRCFQIRGFFPALRYFFSCFSIAQNKEQAGVSPLQAFLTSLGGCIGIGNIVGVSAAICLGGPGAVFWMWCAALLGMLIKYGEIYLGVQYRQKHPHGYKGGPMYFLQRAFVWAWPAKCAAFLLCIYGVEVFMFGVIKDSLVENTLFSESSIVLVLLLLVFVGGGRGIQPLSRISSVLVPIFLLLFSSMVGWVLFSNMEKLPTVFMTVVRSAFSGHAPIGGFWGATIMMGIYRGFQAGCYSGDIGVGYASIIHSETNHPQPQKQARLALVDIFLDTFLVATLTSLLVLVTDVWKEPLSASSASLLVQRALEPHFPHMSFFMPIFLFLLGYTTITAYFHAGIECARFLFPKKGKTLFFIYAFFAFLFFSHLGTDIAFSIMMIAGGLLMLINFVGIFRLRREIDFV